MAYSRFKTNTKPRHSYRSLKKCAFIIFGLLCFSVACTIPSKSSINDQFDYTGLSRLTDPGDYAAMLVGLPKDAVSLCALANKQLVHYRLLSQYKIPREARNNATSMHDIQDILKVLSMKGNGQLAPERILEDRVLSACTKESIFLTSLLRHQNIPARIRVGYLTNLYQGEKVIEFWHNVNQYEREVPVDTSLYNSWTRHGRKVNRSIEHYVTEYYDHHSDQWRIADIMPEFLTYHGVHLMEEFHLKPEEHFEYAWQVWLRRDSIMEDAYAERGLDARSHVRYQMLMDFYSLLNHEGAGIFDENGIQTETEDLTRQFMEKDYSTLSTQELSELDELAELLSNSPSVDNLIEFYHNHETVQLSKLELDPLCFVHQDSLPASGS